MATFVLVPGAWLGGWCWQRVTPLLRAAGHEVYTPTLTGLGERVHLATPEVGLETHVTDVLNVLAFEDLRDVILLGHSYAGIVAGCVADRVADRVAQLVYLAASVPVHGRSSLDEWSPEGRAWIEQQVRDRGDGWRWPLPDDLGPLPAGLTPEDEARLRARATPQPLRTMAEPARLTGAAGAAIPHAFIRCTMDGSALPDVVVEETWPVHRIDTGHWPMISAPRELAAMLARIAAP